jgi:hypothetical protein
MRGGEATEVQESTSTTSLKSTSAKRGVAVGILLLLILCYALQTFSPLRLNTDAVILLSMADSAAHGKGLLDNGQSTVHPPGYPIMIAGLLKFGMGRSFAIICLNLFFLIGGLFATYQLTSRRFLESRMVKLLVCCAALLSFVFVKHFTLPLTDIAFFGTATCTVAFLDYASRQKCGKKFVAVIASAFGMVLISIMIRRIGVSLIPAFLFVLAFQPQVRTYFSSVPSRMKLIISISLLGSLLAIVYVILATSTLMDFVDVISKTGITEIPLRIVSYRLTELGELAVNVPAAKLPSQVQWVLPWLGSGLLSVVVFALSIRRRVVGVVDVYFCGYLAVLFVWPYFDARFWLPVIPLLAGYSALAIGRLAERSVVRTFVAAYCCFFVLAGAASLSYSTRISLAGSKFPDVYGDGSLRPSYCAALGTCPPTGKIDPKVVYLLQAYR